MKMKGFDKKFANLRDYIEQITAEIWEGRGLDQIRDYYAKDVVIHTQGGDIVGVDDTVHNTAQMLSIFPDRRLLPHDIITAEEKSKSEEYYFSSHRIISTMHHRGNGIYGDATGKRVLVYTIADCAVHNNMIYREWLVRDHLAIVKQLNWDPLEFVVRMKELAQSNAASINNKQAKDTKDKSAAAKKIKTKIMRANIATDNLKHLGALARKQLDIYLRHITQIRAQNDAAKIREIYHSACTLFLPGGIVDYGHDAAERFFISYAASFPRAKFSIDSITVNQDTNAPLRIALRWTLEGDYSGGGRFGNANATGVKILGITHSNVYEGKIISEWNLVDEIAILSQIVKN